jgi:hypothetical protein
MDHGEQKYDYKRNKASPKKQIKSKREKITKCGKQNI